MNDGREFIMKHHYSGGCGVAAMTWGLFESVNETMVGAIAFQTPCSENVRRSIFGDEYKDHVTELHRLVTLDDTPHNTESWFISRALKALKEYKPKYRGVVSFADGTEGHIGTIYQATNAIYYGTSSPSTFYRDQDDRLRHPRQCGENITKSDAEERGWEPVRREAKHRYLFLLPDNEMGYGDLEDLLEVEEQPYPTIDDAATAVA